MSQALEHRLIELEARLAHHERMAEEMSAVMARQDREIERLTSHVRQLVERLRGVEAGWERSPQDDKPPPHW
ncbi:MAG: SlyX family protein [Alphaproteobacteria bacterium]|nr:SlyX family protein [Alphaproteobacteria bacterium]MBF0391976.1 SlyX family protein [Alphaproteobacteria bacterium]